MTSVSSRQMENAHRLLIWFFAVVIVATPLLMASWFALCPQYGDPSCPTNARPLAMLAAYRIAPAGLMQAFLAVNLAVAYLFPLGYLGMGLVAWRRSPWLTALGVGCGWVGAIVWGYIADQSFLLTQMAHAQHDAEFAALETAYFADWHILVVATGWVVGHLLGYLFLGIALLRSKLVPAWSAAMIIAAAPIMGPLAYGLNQNALQILGYLMVAVGCVPAARFLGRSGAANGPETNGPGLR
ncbi:MAG: hypothetical protein E6J01_13625 [Chloroflexi bacterium]|nr:MAG: hypothetical protein E6J01_13625 [Chloroflexota bacterium]